MQTNSRLYLAGMGVHIETFQRTYKYVFRLNVRQTSADPVGHPHSTCCRFDAILGGAEEVSNSTCLMAPFVETRGSCTTILLGSRRLVRPSSYAEDAQGCALGWTLLCVRSTEKRFQIVLLYLSGTSLFVQCAKCKVQCCCQCMSSLFSSAGKSGNSWRERHLVSSASTLHLPEHHSRER